MAKVAWIGLGNMGTPMSINLAKAGHSVSVWNRTASKCDAAEGCAKAANVADAAKGAEFIFTMVADSAALLDVVVGQGGICSVLSAGQVVIDMSTVSIESSKECSKAIEAKGATFLRAPVSGSTVLAKDGKLTVLCSGPKASFDKTMPLFEKLSAKQFYLGDGDGARAMKLGLNMMVANTLQMLAESLTLCEKAGLKWETVLDVIGGSVLASPLVLYKTPPIKERKYEPAFSTKLMAKDLDLALSVGKSLTVCAPVTAITKQLLEANIAKGKAEKDFSALIPLIEELSGL